MRTLLFLVLLALGCGGTEAGSDASIGDAGMPDAGDSGVDPDDQQHPLSPLECQTELVALREANFAIEDAPMGYRGSIVGIRRVSTPEGDRSALVELVSETTLATTGDPAPGLEDGVEIAFPFGEIQLAVAPDVGGDALPFPVAAVTRTQRTAGVMGTAVFRFALDGVVRKVVAVGETIDVDGYAGSLAGARDIRMSSRAGVFFIGQTEGRTDLLLHQKNVDGPLTALLRQGLELPATGENRTVGRVDPGYEPEEFGGGVIARVEVRGPSGVEGFAVLHADPTFPAPRCLVTNAAIDCEGIRIAAGETMDVYASDGASTAVVVSGAQKELRVRTPGGDERSIVVNQEFDGVTLTNVRIPRVCQRDSTVFFVGRIGAVEELMSIDQDGNLSQRSNFTFLFGTEGLVGETPDEILNFNLGANCDAILRTKGDPSTGTSPYEGYWAAYDNGDVVEILDETSGREGNGNNTGTLTNVSRSRSSIDPNADHQTPGQVGPNGEYSLLLQQVREAGPFSIYARVIERENQCREPVVVNSLFDKPDNAPGDGVCDTGSLIDGEPECTLRAAVEETNEAPGSDSITFDVGNDPMFLMRTALPPIRSPVTVIGPAIIDRDSSDDFAGVRIESRGVELRDVSVFAFNGDGIVATHYVELFGVTVAGNRGWGMRLEQGGRMDETRLSPSQVERNGAGGGIFQVNPDATLQVSNTEIVDNIGPGILSAGMTVLDDVFVGGNVGDGVVVEPTGVWSGTPLRFLGVVTTSENFGHGMRVAGPFDSAGTILTSEDNCGFGLVVESADVNMRSIERPFGHTLDNNGKTQEGAAGGQFWSLDDSGQPTMRTDVCGGGGLSIIDGELDGSAGNAVIHSTTFNENFGPGVASIAPLRLVDVTANANTGPGVLVATDSPDAADFDSTVLEVNGSSILDNLGSGVVIMEGTARFEDDVSVLRNHASGLRVVTGNVFLNETSGVTRIERNGLMNDSCWVWDFDRGDFRGEMIVACTDAGVDIGNGNLTASGPVIQDNGGEGILIPLDSPMSGVATVNGGTICNNGLPDFVATTNYTGVTTSCP